MSTFSMKSPHIHKCRCGRDYKLDRCTERLIQYSSFYGFPKHYYQEKYPNVGSREIAQKVIDALQEAGIKAEGVKRGLDHGVWASFKCGMYNGRRFLFGSSYVKRLQGGLILTI